MKPQEKLDAARNRMFNELFDLYEILDRVNSHLITDYIGDQLNAACDTINCVAAFAELIFQIDTLGIDFRLLERKCEAKYNIEHYDVIGGRSEDIGYNCGRLFRLEQAIYKNDPDKLPSEIQQYFDVLSNGLDETVSLLEKIVSMKHDEKSIENFKEDYSKKFEIQLGQKNNKK